MFESILCEVTEYDPDVLEPMIGLAIEIARESREGRRAGTLFTLGDEMAVLAKSRPLILDPFPSLPCTDGILRPPKRPERHYCREANAEVVHQSLV